MTDTLKVLAQLNPSATTLTTLYTVPGSTSASISTITVNNQAASSGTFRISVAVAGAADNAKQYLYYDVTVPAKDTFVATLGITLATTDVVRAYASSTSFSFNVFGVEIT